MDGGSCSCFKSATSNYEIISNPAMASLAESSKPFRAAFNMEIGRPTCRQYPVYHACIFECCKNWLLLGAKTNLTWTTEDHFFT